MTIPLRTFIWKQVPSETVPEPSPTPFHPGGSKHVKMAYDPIYNRIVTSGGDHPNSGGYLLLYDYQPELDTGPGSGAWKITSKMCHGPGKLTPWWGMVDDCTAPYIDLRRARRVFFPGSTTRPPGGFNSPCTPEAPVSGTIEAGPAGSDFAYGLLQQDPITRDWSLVRGITTSNPGTGPATVPPGCVDPQMVIPYDIVRDIVWAATGNATLTGYDGNDLQTVRGSVGFRYRNATTGLFSDSPPSGNNLYNPVAGGYWWQSKQMIVPSWCVDTIGRKLYMFPICDCCVNLGDAGIVSFCTTKFLIFDLDTQQVSLGPDIPFGLPTAALPGLSSSGGGNAPWCVFDARNRAIIYFDVRDEAARVNGVYVYPLATQVWEHYPVTQDNMTPGPPNGNSWVYHVKENLCIGGGSYGSVSTCWWWRYK